MNKISTKKIENLHAGNCDWWAYASAAGIIGGLFWGPLAIIGLIGAGGYAVCEWTKPVVYM